MVPWYVRTEVPMYLSLPDYWIRPPRLLSEQPGLHRFVWDLHWPPPPAPEFTYPISAVPGDTPREPRGPWALPGLYTVRLTLNGQTLTQPLRLKMDPRVKASEEDLRAQFDRSMEVARDMGRLGETRARLKAEPAASPGPAAGARAAREKALGDLASRLLALYTVLQEADAAPTAAAVETVESLHRQVTDAIGVR